MLDYKFGDHLPVHEHGRVTLLDIMGSDSDIVDAARISYDRRSKNEDRALIRYLMRHNHTSPFEMAEMKFELSMPIFVARQWVRHRTASMNEVSARYTQLPAEMFVPDIYTIEKQSKDNKQGREGSYTVDEAGHIAETLTHRNNEAYETYSLLIEKGDLSREIARGILPLNTYTKFVWKIDLHNLLHFLKLRLHPHAQQEIRDYAEVIAKLVNLHFPITYEAFKDYQLEAHTCSRMEVNLISELLSLLKRLELGRDLVNERDKEIYGMTLREIREFREKFDG